MSDADSHRPGLFLRSHSESRHYFDQSLFREVPLGVLIADMDGRLLDVNPALCQITGYSREELLQLRQADLTSPDDLAAGEALSDSVVTGERSTSASVRRYQRKDGQLIWIQVTGSLVRDPGGGEQFGVAFFQDISEQIRAVEALRRSEATFATAFNYGPVILSITRLSDGRIIEVNEQFLSATGYSRDEVIGHTPLELNLWVNPQQRAEGLTQLRQGHVVRQGQADFRMKDGQVRTCLLFGTVIEVNGERSVLTALTDITERRQAELEAARLLEENARLYREAQEAIQLRDAFFSIASHELKTPLTSLLGQAQLLQRRLEQDEKFDERKRRSLQSIVAQASRLHGLIDELLDVAQMERGQFALNKAPVDLAGLVRRVVDETLLDRRHRLLCSAPAGALLVLGDAVRLEQVIQNLVQNALKYSPAGGQVELLVERVGAMARLVVRDQGIGIPPAAVPRLFERFYRAANAGASGIKGLGVGLYIVREIVSLHGGSITIASAEGDGSTFTITLPLLDAAG